MLCQRRGRPREAIGAGEIAQSFGLGRVEPSSVVACAHKAPEPLDQVSGAQAGSVGREPLSFNDACHTD